MHRQTNNGLEFAAPGAIFTPELFNGAQFALVNGRRDRYDSVDFTLRRTFAGKYEWFLGYTRSSARTSAALDYSLINPIYGSQGPGPFPWDTPNRIHMWGWAPLPNSSCLLFSDSPRETPRSPISPNTAQDFPSVWWMKTASWPAIPIRTGFPRISISTYMWSVNFMRFIIYGPGAWA